MYRNHRVAVVMPAYNAERTLRATYDEVVDQGIVDDIILVDDGSRDGTVSLARTLPGVTVHVHDRNQGYGGNQKSCYRIALDERGETPGTRKFAEQLASLEMRGDVKCIAFLIGAADGHSPEVREKSNRVISLSSFTLQHELALLVLLEQLYRIASIKTGSPYHRD
jgi:glycosyltransferase involved in cell wall biosynthesis